MQRCGRPPLPRILPHFSSLMSKTLTTCTSSTLQKPRRQDEGSPLPLNISPSLPPPFCLLENSSRFNQTPALSSTAQRIQLSASPARSLLYGSRLLNPNTFRQQRQQSHVTFCQDIYIIPHRSTLRPPGCTASCRQAFI